MIVTNILVVEPSAKQGNFKGVEHGVYHSMLPSILDPMGGS